MKNVKESLSAKALIGIIGILIPILIVFVLSYHRNKEHAKQRILDDLTIIAESYEGRVYLFLDKLKQRAEDFASDGFIKNHLLKNIRGSRGALQCASTSKNKRAVDTLSKHLIKNKIILDKDINTIHVISLEGRVIASTDKQKIGKDYSNDAIFTKGKEATTIIETIVEQGGLPELAVSAPVLTKDTHRLIGVIVNFIHISKLSNILSGKYVEGLGAVSQFKKGKWKTMEVYLVNRNKLMITNSIFVKDAVLKQIVNTQPVDAGLQAQEEIAGFYNDYRGIKVAGASMYIPSLKWALLAEIDEDEVLAPAKEMLINVLITAIVVVGLIIFLFIVFIKKVVNPLRIISNAAKSIARVNLDIVIPNRARDEIGTLCESINNMAYEIKDRTTALAGSEEKLRNSELKYRTVADFTWDWEFLMNLQRRFIYVSPSCERISGYTPAEFMGSETLFLGIVHPDDYDKMHGEIENAFLQHIQTSIDFRIVCKNGEFRWLSIAYQPVTGNDNTFLGVRGSIRDITERKRSEEELKLLQTIIIETSQAHNLHDALVVAIQKVCNMTGWTYGEAWMSRQAGALVVRNRAFYGVHDDLQRFSAVTENIIFPVGVGLPGRAWIEKHPVWEHDITADQTYLSASIAREVKLKTGAAFPIISDNEVITVIVFYMSEATEKDERLVNLVSTVMTQLGSIIKRKKTETVLRESHKHNEQLIAAIPSILIYISDNDRIIGWNKTAERVFGIPSEEAMGKPFCECGIQWQDRRVVEQILDCRNTDQPTRIDDVRFKNLVGKTGFLGITVNPITETEKKTINFINHWK